MTTITDEQIITLAADHHMPVRFPHEVIAFGRALLTTQAATNAAAKLTDEQIKQLWHEAGCKVSVDTAEMRYDFGRAIESAVLASLAPAGLETLTRYMFTYEGMEVDNACGRYYLADDVDTFFERWAASHAGAAAEPAAWMRYTGKECTSASTKAWMENCGFGHWPSIAKEYTIPLYTSPAAAPSSAAIPTVIREAVEAAFEDRADWRTKIAAAVRALGDAPSSADVRAAGWISVEDRLPSNDEYVWASWIGAGNWNHEAKQGLARYVDGLGWQPTQSMGWDWIVTHWMPLPAAPVTNGDKGEAK